MVGVCGREGSQGSAKGSFGQCALCGEADPPIGCPNTDPQMKAQRKGKTCEQAATMMRSQEQ